METVIQDPPPSQPADSEQIVKSPTESIFSDDDDIWFEASDQLASELHTTSPPLTPTEAVEGEVLSVNKAGPPLIPIETEKGEGEQQLRASPPLTPMEGDEGEGGAPNHDQEREISTEQPTSEDKSDEALDYQDAGTSVETKNLDSTLPMIAQDTSATERAQNTDDLIMGAPHEIDIFMDVQEVDAMIIEDDSAFVVVKDSTTALINIQDNDGSLLNQDTDDFTTTQDTESAALKAQKDDASELMPVQDSTDALVGIPDIVASEKAQSDDASAVTHDMNTTANVNTNLEDDGASIAADSHGIDVDDALDDQKSGATSESANQDIGVSLVNQDKAISVNSHQSEVYLAESMVKELKKQQKMTESCKAEANYVEVCTAVMIKAASVASSESVTEGIGESISMENDGMGMGHGIEPPAEQDGMETRPSTIDDATPPLTFDEQPIKEQHQQEGIDIHTVSAHNVEIYLAESLVRELKMQQKMVESCKVQTRYMEVCSSATMTSKEPVASASSEPEKSLMEENDFAGIEMERDVKTERDSSENATAMDLEPTEHVQENITQESNSDGLQAVEIPQKLEAIPPPALLVAPKVAMFDASTNTDPVNICSQSTNTLTPEFSTQGVNTDPPPVSKEIGCNTMLNCFDVLQRAKEMEELQFLKVEHQIAVRQMNEAKSQKMVAEQLTNIVQSDLAELRQQNLTETTRRLQLENELSDTKIELSQTVTQLKEKEERVQELEESLSGTSLLVRKLEEQNAVSLMSRGGIDYMLQAKLAEGRAQEAEQKLEVVQSELLQAQSEVRRLLDRVAEASRNRSEMVSSRVHTQLIQIADERAEAAERRNLELERQVQDLRGRLSMYEAGGGGMGVGGGGRLTGSSGLTGLTGFSGLSGLGGGSSYATSGLGSTYSPFSYSSAMATKPLSLSEQYNIHSDLAPPTFSSSATPTSFTSLFLGGMSNGASSKQLGGSAIYSNDDVGLNKAPGVSGILKPSQMFKKHGDGSHDQASNGSHAHSSHVTSSEGADGGDIELPSFEATPTKPHSPTKVKFSEKLESGQPSSVARGDDDGDKSESSDWSSSSEGEDGDADEGRGGGVGGMKPSHHTNLIAEWEWRTMTDGSDTSSAHPPSSSPLTKRRVPPPVAPKPHGIFKPSSMTGGGVSAHDRTVQFEPSISFDTPTHSATLQGLRRSRGPRGRSLPSRYRGNNNWLLNVNN